MKELVGNWTLLTYITEHPDGSIGKPYADAVGRLSYDAHGNMAGQVMRPGRAAVVHRQSGIADVRAAYAGYIAYFGTYQVNDARDTVIHRVQGALNPTWVGGDQVRQMRFEADRLILSTNVLKGGVQIRHVLTWQRLD
jgi:hypothetical protein